MDKRKAIKKGLNHILISFGVILIVLSFLFYFVKPEILMNIGYSKLLSYHAKDYDEELRQIGIEIVRGCDNKYCNMIKLTDYFNKFTYVNSANNRLYSYKDTIKNLAGDCDDLSYAFSALAYNIGLDVDVECNIDHCWNKIFLYNQIYEYDATTNKLSLIGYV